MDIRNYGLYNWNVAVEGGGLSAFLYTLKTKK